MQAGKIEKVLKPFSVLTDRNAVSPLYKSIELGPDAIRGFSTCGMMQAELALPIDDVCYVDTTAFLAVLRSFPATTMLEFELKKNVLHWTAGQAANGRIATVQVDNAPDFPNVKARGEYEPTEQFKTALELGSLSADRPTISAAGFYAVLLDNADVLTICSTDNTTISLATAGEGSDALPDQFCMHPDAARVLAAVLDTENGILRVNDDYLEYDDGLYRFVCRSHGDPEKLKILDIADQYKEEQDVAEIDADRLQAFLRRVYAIGESRNDAYVSLGAADGHIVLSFDEQTASTTEYFVGNGIPDVEPQRFRAVNIARALSSTDRVVLDHLARRVLVLRGSEPEFAFMITTR